MGPQLYSLSLFTCPVWDVMYQPLPLICQLLEDYSQQCHCAWHIAGVQKLLNFTEMSLELDSSNPGNS